ncbi:hypothetical protein F4775DRAFT_563146 [Biscogniauxia sp. FL1348]|nr:hypothetical protein F4775DRAFT_563146 [Biscogniauxia sp. FL1348]
MCFCFCFFFCFCFSDQAYNTELLHCYPRSQRYDDAWWCAKNERHVPGDRGWILGSRFWVLGSQAPNWNWNGRRRKVGLVPNGPDLKWNA